MCVVYVLCIIRDTNLALNLFKPVSKTLIFFIHSVYFLNSYS